MNERTVLLEKERQKLIWLRERIELVERRIKALEALEDDPLDEMFEKAVAAKPVAIEPTERDDEVSLADLVGDATAHDSTTANMMTSYAWHKTPRQISPKWMRIFRFIGREGKTYDQVRHFVVDNKLDLTGDAIRAALMNYRKDFGLIENPRRGFYVATDRCLELVEQQEKESPASEAGGASGPQPTPWNRVAA